MGDGNGNCGLTFLFFGVQVDQLKKELIEMKSERDRVLLFTIEALGRDQLKEALVQNNVRKSIWAQNRR